MCCPSQCPTATAEPTFPSHGHSQHCTPTTVSRARPLPSQPLTPSGCYSSPLTPPQLNRGEAQPHPEQGTAGPSCPGHCWASQVQCAHLVKLPSARQHCSQRLWMSSQETWGCYRCACLACHLQHLTINRKQTHLVKDRYNLESTPWCAQKSVLFCPSAGVLKYPKRSTADFWSDLSCLTFALGEL